eukprot:5076527-Karenia_brevis.AAC.1
MGFPRIGCFRKTRYPRRPRIGCPRKTRYPRPIPTGSVVKRGCDDGSSHRMPQRNMVSAASSHRMPQKNT